MKGFGFALILLVLVGTVGVVADSGDIVKIKTHLPEIELIADGITVYELEVRANTVDLFVSPGVEKFNAAEWDILIPSYINILNGSLPDGTNSNPGPSTEPNDFFYSFLMDSGFNVIDTIVNGGILGDGISNVRLTNDVFDGPSNMTYANGLLGKWTFTVNESAPLGNGNFSLDDVKFLDTDFLAYDVIGGPSPDILIENDVFNITAPVTFNPADINQDGDVDVGDLALVGGQWGTDGTGHPLGYSADVAPIGNPDGEVDVGDLAVVGSQWGL